MPEGRRGRDGRAIATLVLVVWLVNFLLLASRGEFEIIFFIVFSMLFITNRCFLCQTFVLGFSIMATTVLDLAQTEQIDCQPFFFVVLVFILMFQYGAFLVVQQQFSYCTLGALLHSITYLCTRLWPISNRIFSSVYNKYAYRQPLCSEVIIILPGSSLIHTVVFP